MFGGGGIVTGEHAAQLIMCGARAVQISSGMLYHGRRQLRKINKFLSDYMDRYGYRTIEDFRGLGARNVRNFVDICPQLLNVKIVSETDESKCNGCGICTDTMCPARYLENGIAKVRTEDCNICGLCILCCPEGAVHYAPCDLSLGDRIRMGP